MSKERSLGMSQDIPEPNTYDREAVRAAFEDMLDDTIENMAKGDEIVRKGRLSSDAREVAERYFAHEDDPSKPPTPLQQRMQSGGA